MGNQVSIRSNRLRGNSLCTWDTRKRRFVRSLEGFRCFRGCHHGVSPRHLQAYLNEFTFRFNLRFYPFNAFRSLLGISGQAFAPTYDGLYTGSWQHPKCSGERRASI
jgi:hypothetical protein